MFLLYVCRGQSVTNPYNAERVWCGTFSTSLLMEYCFWLTECMWILHFKTQTGGRTSQKLCLTSRSARHRDRQIIQMCCAAWWNQCECANWQHNQLSVIMFMKYERFHVLIQNMPAFWVCALTGKPWLCHKQELIDDSLQATQGHAPFCCRLSKNISDIWKSKRDFVSPRPS